MLVLFGAQGPVLATVLLAILGSAVAQYKDDSKAIIVKAAGYKEIQPSIDIFQKVLGGENNGNAPGPIKNGFRAKNWDAPIVPFDMPGTFFRDTVPRGINLLVSGDEWRVSNPPKTDPGFPDNLFDSINKQYPQQFRAFSPERIFAPLTDYVFLCEFSIPGSPKNEPAYISGFGAVFVDVDNEDTTSMEFFDPHGESLGVYYVPADPQGLSFLGVYFKDEVVATVKVTLGNAKLGQDDFPPNYDVVVTDDFIWSEPQPVMAPGKVPAKPSPKPALPSKSKFPSKPKVTYKGEHGPSATPTFVVTQTPFSSGRRLMN
eukprot:evm.model.scf_1444.5 EVM.evm.TU.scf_1444.5   scf_1444:35713-37215(+)